MGWATADDVLATTGRAVDAPTLAMAAGVVEVYSNRTLTASGAISARDRHWLVVAECWQAAWLANQFGYDQRIAASSVTQDGVVVQHRGQYEEDLAPLASRALRNLSWKGSRALRAPSANVRPGRASTDFLNEASDDLLPWSPI